MACVLCIVLYCALHHPTITAVCHPGVALSRKLCHQNISSAGDDWREHRNIRPGAAIAAASTFHTCTSTEIRVTPAKTHFTAATATPSALSQSPEKMQMWTNISGSKIWKGRKYWDVPKVGTRRASSQSHCLSRAVAGWFWFKSTRVITSTLHRSMKHWMQTPQSWSVEVRGRNGRPMSWIHRPIAFTLYFESIVF